MDSERRNMSQQICNSAALSIGSTAETLTNRAALLVQPERCRRGRILSVCLVAGLLALHGCGGGSSGGGTTAIPSGASSSAEHWNHIAIDASGLDHTTGDRRRVSELHRFGAGAGRIHDGGDRAGGA
jgi:hypothetical protein